MPQFSEKSKAIAFFAFLGFAIIVQVVMGGKLSLSWALVLFPFCVTVAILQAVLDRYQSRK